MVTQSSKQSQNQIIQNKKKKKCNLEDNENSCTGILYEH